MKQFLHRMLLLSLVALIAACTPDTTDDPPQPTTCEDNQIELDGECVTLSGPELQLRQALLGMAEHDNFQIDVTITDPAGTNYDVILKRDGALSMVADLAETIYTTHGDTCETTTVIYDTIATTTTPCVEEEAFYRQFTYDMFTLEAGVYRLSDASIDAIEETIGTILTDASLSGLTLSILPDAIDRITMTLTRPDGIYTIVYAFTNYDDVTIVIPAEE